MRLNIMPKTRLGKWAVRLGIASVVLTALSLLCAVVVRGNPTTIVDNSLFLILFTTLSVAFSLASLLSFFVGIFAIIKHKEWSVCVSLAVLYCLTALMFILGEFLSPH